MYKYPDRKNYIYTLPTKKGDLVLRFKQATAEETKEYHEISDKLWDEDILVKYYATLDMYKYYVNFLKSACGLKRYHFKRRAILNQVLESLDDYIGPVMAALHPLRLSVYTNIKEPKVKGQKDRPVVFENLTESISKKTFIPADEVYKRLTMEQVGRYNDKVIFQSYETFTEGKQANDKIMRGATGASSEDDEDLAIIKAQKGL